MGQQASILHMNWQNPSPALLAKVSSMPRGHPTTLERGGRCKSQVVHQTQYCQGAWYRRAVIIASYRRRDRMRRSLLQRTSPVLGPLADITIALTDVRFRGVKRTSKFKSVTSAFDPKRTSPGDSGMSALCQTQTFSSARLGRKSENDLCPGFMRRRFSRRQAWASDARGNWRQRHGATDFDA
jgi:hypothetical protein